MKIILTNWKKNVRYSEWPWTETFVIYKENVAWHHIRTSCRLFWRARLSRRAPAVYFSVLFHSSHRIIGKKQIVFRIPVPIYFLLDNAAHLRITTKGIRVVSLDTEAPQTGCYEIVIYQFFHIFLFFPTSKLFLLAGDEIVHQGGETQEMQSIRSVLRCVWCNAAPSSETERRNESTRTGKRRTLPSRSVWRYVLNEWLGSYCN